MNHYTHILAEDQARLDAAGVSAGQESRLARLMVENGELRAQLDAQREASDALLRRVRELTADLATATGANATPKAGCKIVDVPIPGGRMLVEIDTDGAGFDMLNVFIGGHWIDVQDLHAATDLDVLRESVTTALEDA